MASQMNFGPEWMRGGNNSSVNEPTKDSPSYKYSKEYMLSLYTPDAQPSVQLKHHEYAVVSESQSPLSSLNKDDDNNGKNTEDDDVPLWSHDDKENMGTFDSNGVFHLSSPSDLPLGNTEFEQRNDAVFSSSSSLFESSNEHRRAVSQPNTSFFTTATAAISPPVPMPTNTNNSTTLYTWTYRDPSGNVQGPFTALEMQEWFEAGYFDHALNVKREDAPFFEPLSALIRKVNDANTPFFATWPAHQQDNTLLPSLTSPTSAASGFSQSPFASFRDDRVESTSFDQFQHVPSKPTFAIDSTTIDVMRGDENGYTFHTNTSSSSPFGNAAPFISPMTRGLPGNSSIRTPLSPWDRPSSHSWLESENDISLHSRQSSIEPLNSPGFAMNEFQQQQQQQQQQAISRQMEQQYLNMLRQNQQQHLQMQQRILLQQQQQQQQQQPDMFINPRLGFDQTKNLSLHQQPMAFRALNKGWNSVPGTPTVADSGHNVWGLPDRLPQQLPLTPAVLDSSSPLSVSPRPSGSEEKVEQAVNDQLTEALNQLNLTAPDTAERLTSKDIQAEDDNDDIEAAPSNPVVPTWTSASVQKKTLREIQKEEEKHANYTPRSNTWSSVSSRTSVPISSSFSTNTSTSRISSKQQSKPWEKPTTARRQKHLSMTASIPPTSLKLNSQHQPSTKTATASRHPTIKSEPRGPSEEFLKWCKLSLRNLNAGVNGDEILQMLLTFPLDNSCAEIIQDIIYANSSSMDGRRFASDFMTRRKADMDGKKLNVILPTSSAVSTPEFKVVTKKNKKKHQQQ